MADKKRKRKKSAEPKTFADVWAGPAAVSGIVVMLFGLAWFAIADKATIPVWVFWAVGLALLVWSIASKPQTVKSYIGSRQMAMGANTTTRALIVLGIVCFVNYIFSRHHHRFDWTKNRSHSLSEQTEKILKSLDKKNKDVTVTAIAVRRGADYANVENLLNSYKYYAGKRLKSQVIDYYRNPQAPREHGITEGTPLPVTVVECGGKREQVSTPDEQSLTSAILKVTTDKVKKIYFLQGHGERDPADSDQRRGYSSAKDSLTKLNYQVDTLSLMKQEPRVPDDCSVLVVAGPRTAPLPAEATAINEFLDSKGKALFMLDPESPALADILGKWGMTAEPGLIVEPSAMYYVGNAVAPVIQKFEQHAITNAIMGSAVFLFARPIKSSSPPGGDLQVTDLAKTSSDSWDEPNLTVKKVSPSGKAKGPFALMTLASTGAPPPPQNPYGPPPPPPPAGPKTRLIVVGDSDFAGNELIDSPSFANKNLFTNTVNWLAEEEELVAIQPKPPVTNRVDLTGSQVRLVFFLSVILIPFCVLLTGGIVWWKRR